MIRTHFVRFTVEEFNDGGKQNVKTLKRVVVSGNLEDAELIVLIDDENNRLVTIEGVRDYGELEDNFKVIEEIEELE